MQLYDFHPEAPYFEQVSERAYYCLAPYKVQQHIFQRDDQIYCLNRDNPSDWKLYRNNDKCTVDSLWEYTYRDKGIEEGAWADLFLDNSADLALLAHAIVSLKMDHPSILCMYRNEGYVYDTIHRGYLHLEKVNENTFRTVKGEKVVIRSIGYGFAKDKWSLI